MPSPASASLRYAERTVLCRASAREIAWLEEFLGPWFTSSQSAKPDCTVGLKSDHALARALLDQGPPPADLDVVQQIISGGDAGGDIGGDAGGDLGGEAGGDVSGDAGGDVAGDAGGDVAGDAGGDVAGDAGGDVGGDGWSAGSFNALDGDQMMASNFEGGVDDFLLLLAQEDPENVALFQAAENLGNPEIAQLAQALGEILGQYDIVMSASIPTDAFGGTAKTLIPGLLTFQPTADAETDGDSEGSDFRPSGFAMFQF